MNRRTGTALLAAFMLLGCGQKQTEKDVENLGRANAPAAQAPAAQGPATAGKAGSIHRGTVLETMDVANYSYIRFQTESGEERWAAVFKDTFAVGDKVAIAESIVMKDFHSASLNRTFPLIIFGGLLEKNGAAPAPRERAPETEQAKLPQGHPPMDQMPAGHPPTEPAPAPAKPAADGPAPAKTAAP